MLLSAVVALLVAADSAYALWPLPQHLSTGTTALKLSPSFDIKLSGISGAPQDLLDAITRTKTYLKTDKLQILTVDRGASSAGAISAAKLLKSLTISFEGSAKGKKVRSISDEAVDALESRVEGYSLTVPADGSAATLTANSTLGLFRGLTTFGQLWYDLKGTTYTLEAPYQIVDAPAYVCDGNFGSHIPRRLTNFSLTAVSC